jgi:hypothetical protein
VRSVLAHEHAVCGVDCAAVLISTQVTRPLDLVPRGKPTQLAGRPWEGRRAQECLSTLNSVRSTA